MLREWLASPAGYSLSALATILFVLLIVAVLLRTPTPPARKKKPLVIGVTLRGGPLDALKLSEIPGDICLLFVYEFEPYTHYRARLSSMCDLVTVGGTMYGFFTSGMPPTVLYDPPPVHVGEYYRPTSASIYADYRERRGTDVVEPSAWQMRTW